MMRRLGFVGLVTALFVSPSFQEKEEARRENNRGIALLEEFRPKDAAESFRRARTLDPGFIEAEVNLGIARFYAQDPTGAREVLESVLASHPQDLHAQYVLGLISRQQNRADEALTRFRKVLEGDPADVGANVSCAQVLLQERREAEAIPFLETAVGTEPYNVTAVYNLSLALSRAGRREDAVRASERFQALRDKPYKTSLGNGYLEQGRFAEAEVAAELEEGPAAAGEAFYTDKTNEWLGEPGPHTAGTLSTVSLADLDGDGRLDLVDTSGGRLRIFRNNGSRFVDETSKSGPIEARAVVVGDFDNDGHPDLLVLQASTIRLLKGDGAWHFVDVTASAHLPEISGATTAAFVDVDHDGDLDIVVAGASGPHVLRNNGNGTFTEIQVGLKAGGHAVAIVPTDFDEHRDIDLLFAFKDAPPALYKNLRDGRFEDVAKEVGLPQERGFSCVAAGDVNKDSYTDFFFGSLEKPGVFALSDGKGRFVLHAAPESTKGALAALFFDYDGDGRLDLLVLTQGGPRILRNVGTTFEEVAPFRGPRALGPGLAVGDVDGDGVQDIVATEGTPRFLKGEGKRGRFFEVRLEGRVSNHSAIGAKVELRAGGLGQKLETSAATPAVAPADIRFGLGSRTRPDSVRVLWPSGILQAEANLESPGALRLTELDRKPSSCPYLYAWDGSRFRFITDFLGGGEMGYWEGVSEWNHPHPTEDVRITDEQLREREGHYEIRITNELEEALFLDEVHLLAVAHPSDVEIYPNEGMTSPPRPSKLWAVRDLRSPTAAFDDSGHDQLAAIHDLDRKWPDAFRKLPVRGYAEDHTLTLDLAGLGEDHTLLVATGWTDYAFSSDNFAASQAGLALVPPRLEVLGKDGVWRTGISDIGIPVGRPQSIVLDLRGLLPSTPRKVRIRTNMRIYWDQIRIGAPAAFDARVERLDPIRAELTERGFSAEIAPDGREPWSYDYARISTSSPWKQFPGHYTRTGDVRELLRTSDDLFVVSRPGDEIALDFDAHGLKTLPAGWRRTFLLHGDGFSKEMDIHSATPDELGPLPFHGMSRYPYSAPETWPATEARRELMERYSTRFVGKVVPILDERALKDGR